MVFQRTLQLEMRLAGGEGGRQQQPDKTTCLSALYVAHVLTPNLLWEERVPYRRCPVGADLRRCFTVVLTQRADPFRPPEYREPVSVEQFRTTFRNDQLISPANHRDQRTVGK